MARDKASLDIFWLKDDSLENLDDLPPPDVLQQEIIDHLEAALAAFRDVAESLPASSALAESARQAERAGMTPEILDELLRDES
jgi:type I restriction enzyme M protein